MESYYQKCNDDPEHLCDRCITPKYRKTDNESLEVTELKDIIKKISNGKPAHANLTFRQKTYLESLGYNIRYQRMYKVQLSGKNYKITKD